MPDQLFESLPDWLDAEAWAAFVEMRREKGKRAPFTARAEKNMLAHLERMHRAGHDVTEAVWKSVRAGWSDVYPPKETAMAPAGRAVAIVPAAAQYRQKVGNAWLGRHGKQPADDQTIDMEAPNGTRSLPR